MFLLTRLSPLIILFTLCACSPLEVSTYADRKPMMVMEEFFDGPLTAHGIVKDRSGKVIRTFSATIDASWDGTDGVLDENFIFDDGELQQRIWQLKKVSEGHYVGTAADVVGEASIYVAGNSVFLDYVLQIDYDGQPLNLHIDDRMYLTSPSVMINESTMNKFGITVGHLLLVINKQ